nr:transposase [Bacillus sp. SD075]
MGNIKRTFDKAFKKQAVDLYLNGDMSYINRSLIN